jgi:hypothetical protein
MAKPYKLTPIELFLSPKDHFEDNLDKFLNNETIPDDEKLILFQNALRLFNKYKPYREKLLKVNVIDQPSDNSETPKKEDLLTSVVDLLPQSYREQSKRLLAYLADK